MPAGKEVLPGVQRWHRPAIEIAAAHFWAIGATAPARTAKLVEGHAVTRRMAPANVPMADDQHSPAKPISTLAGRPPGERFLKLQEVKSMVGLGQTSIYRMMNEDRFPAARRVGDKAVRWLASEVEAWMRVRQRGVNPAHTPNSERSPNTAAEALALHSAGPEDEARGGHEATGDRGPTVSGTRKPGP
jgi:prophage regulatory protein